MLGTLVALSIARMPNLQTFIWDMPTGILRDCWLALSSLGEGKANGDSSLETIWIRFHDNKEVIANPDWIPQPAPEHLRQCKNLSSIDMRLAWSYRNTEYPSFSVLPPLRSVNVMNIDEIAYVEELSVLLGRSINSLRKLRIGIACAVPHEGFASIAVGLDSLGQDEDLSTTYKGALDLLLSKICGADKLMNGRSIVALAPEELSSDNNLKHATAKSIPSANHSATSGWLPQFHAPTILPAPELSIPVNIDTTADPAGVFSGLVTKASHTTPLENSPLSNILSAIPSPKSSATTPIPTSDLMYTTDKGKRAWPPSVRNYVMCTFKEGSTSSDIKAADFEQKLKRLIQQSVEAGTLTTVDWDNLPLPQAMLRTERDRGNNAQMPANSALLDGSLIPLDGDNKVNTPLGGPVSNKSRLDDLVNPMHPVQGKAAKSKATTPCPTTSPTNQEQKQLRLEVLELERVYISVPALLKAIDWSVVTTLTLLHCENHEQLWKAFRRIFAPRMTSPTSPDVSKPLCRHKNVPRLSDSADLSSTRASEYRLNLRRIHTDTVSSALIQFLKETLAPNSLEWLFLQDSGAVTTESSPVTIDQIFKGPIRRHKSSLKKLMIDSARPAPSARWRKWKFDREILSYIVGGKMGALREVAFSLDYKDWVSKTSHTPT